MRQLSRFEKALVPCVMMVIAWVFWMAEDWAMTVVMGTVGVVWTLTFVVWDDEDKDTP